MAARTVTSVATASVNMATKARSMNRRKTLMLWINLPLLVASAVWRWPIHASSCARRANRRTVVMLAMASTMAPFSSVLSCALACALRCTRQLSRSVTSACAATHAPSTHANAAPTSASRTIDVASTASVETPGKATMETMRSSARGRSPILPASFPASWFAKKACERPITSSSVANRTRASKRGKNRLCHQL